MESLVMVPMGHAPVGMLYGSTVDERVESLKVHARAIYMDMGIVKGEQPQGGIRRANWSKASSGRNPHSYPILMQKGGVVKAILAVLLHICDNIVTVNLPEEMAAHRELLTYRRLLLRALVDLHEVCDSSGQFFKPEEVARFVSAVDRYIGAKQWLTNYYRPTGSYMYQMTVKVHYLEHLKLTVINNRVNPRFFWVVRDEDHVGRIAMAIKSCMKAGGGVRSSRSIATKLCSGYVLRSLMMAWGIDRTLWGVM